MKIFSWIVSIAMFFHSCSSTYFIKHDQSAYEEVNQKAKGNKIRVTMMDNQIIDTDNITVGADSLRWVNKVDSRKPIAGGHVYFSEEKEKSVATADIATIDIKNTRTGLGIGLLVGCAATLVIYANMPSGGMFPREQFWWSLLWIPGLTAAFGAAVGVETKYIFQSDDDINFERNESNQSQNLDKSPVRIEFSFIVAKETESIIIIWKNRKIRLLNPEYIYRGTSEDGTQYIIVPKYIYERKFLPYEIENTKKKNISRDRESLDNGIDQPYKASGEDKSSKRVEFSSLVEKGNGYLVILWHGKEIRLLRSEYSYRGTSVDGKAFIVVPNQIYENKFQEKK